MKSGVLVSFVIALLAVLVPTAALAKGATEAEIVGPGLDGPISLAGEGRPGGGQLMQLAEAAGFFSGVFVQVPDPMLSERPEGDLGPRYTITYVMPGPNNEVDRLRQGVYPYAKPNPVTYMAPGQPFFGTERTHGGWYVATVLLKDELVAAGLPDMPRRPGGGAGDRDGSPFPWTLVGVLIAIGAPLGLAALGAFLIRRRPRPASTA